MESADFNWIVMAIRIQREVGGNLAELLLSVAETLRERDYLRRQVKSLSAEGRLSAWMLGALPVGLLMYMAVANRPYVEPMFTNPIGWVMLAMMLILNAVGFFWMSRMVKVVI
jgi:tight adherence protein B